jgi:hypothetical protein
MKPIELEELLKQLQDLERQQEESVAVVDIRTVELEEAELTLEKAREGLQDAEDAADKFELEYNESRSALVEAIGEETVRIYNNKYAAQG